jgi:ABC-type uncharacterized transport system substrate-binding protein
VSAIALGIAGTPANIDPQVAAIVGPLLHATSTVPIVFTQTPDPVGAGFSSDNPEIDLQRCHDHKNF